MSAPLLEEVFKTSGVPTFTFVEPSEYTKLLVTFPLKILHVKPFVFISGLRGKPPGRTLSAAAGTFDR